MALAHSVLGVVLMELRANSLWIIPLLPDLLVFGENKPIKNGCYDAFGYEYTPWNVFVYGFGHHC